MRLFHRRTPSGRFTLGGHYVPDIGAHRQHDAEVWLRVLARHNERGCTWVSTAPGVFCSFCSRARTAVDIPMQPLESMEEPPLFLVAQERPLTTFELLDREMDAYLADLERHRREEAA